MVTSIFVVEPITEPTLRVGKKVLKNYNHHSQQEYLPGRKSTRLSAASTSPSSATSATAVAKSLVPGKPSPEKTRCISSCSSSVSQEDQTLSRDRDQSPNKAQEEKKTLNYCETSLSSSSPVSDVAAAPKPAPATFAPTRIIKHNLLLGPTLMRQKRQQKRKERQAKADAMKQQLVQEERRRKEMEREMVKSGLVSNMSNLQKTLARVSSMKKKKPTKRAADDASNTLCDCSQGTKSCSNNTADSRLAMTDRDEYDTVPEDDVYTFDTKPRSRWISASYFTEHHSNKDLFKYSNIHSVFFTNDSDSHGHLTSGCQESQTKYQTTLPNGFTKWLQQKVAGDKEKQRQVSLNHPEEVAQRTVCTMPLPDKEISDQENEIVKRGRGRPKGSTNKKKNVSAGGTAEREGERPKIDIFELKYDSPATKEEPVSYPRWAGREEQTISRSVTNEPSSPEERHELAKQLIA